MKKLLLVIDVQRDFINQNTSKTLDNLKKLIDLKKYDLVAFTRFINDKSNILYKKLNYKGCMTAKQQEIVIHTVNYKIFDKRVYTAVNSELKQFIEKNKIDEIYLCGFDTDACILKTALDLFENNYCVKIIENCCMSSYGKEVHQNAINILKKLIGEKNIINDFS